VKPFSLALLALLACGPKKAPEPVVAPPPAAPVDPEAWRANKPGPGKPSAWQPPVAQRFELSNGIDVLLVENPALPLVSVRLFMAVGSEANPKGKAGLAHLTAELLDEGTKTRSATQIANDTATLGARLEVAPAADGATVSLDALAGENLGPSLDLLADVVRNPKLDAKELKRVQSEALADLQSAASDPRDRAGRAFRAAYFGANHPYGAPSRGDAKSVKALTAKDVTDFYKRWWTADKATLVVSGATTEAELKPLLEARFGSWKVGTQKRVDPPTPLLVKKTRLVFVEMPGQVQSFVMVTAPGLARTSPEYFPATMAGTLVGGMFSSPINMNLREDKGWSYGAFGGFTDSRDLGWFGARASVQADKTAPAITEVIKELEAAAAKAPSAEQLQMAKDYLVKSLAGNFETNPYTAGSFTQAPQFGLGPDLWRTYVTGVEGVDAAAAQAAAQRTFQRDHLLIVVAGPRTVEIDDGKGNKSTVDVFADLQKLGFEITQP
jgi:zinc protease